MYKIFSPSRRSLGLERHPVFWKKSRTRSDGSSKNLQGPKITIKSRTKVRP